MADITFYTGLTQDGRKVSILLEELGIDYDVEIIDVEKNEQNASAYRAVNPKGKIPALVDRNPAGGGEIIISESGAIMLYLAEKYDRFLGSDTASRTKALEWLFFQCAGLGPMASQGHHFRYGAPEKNEYAIERYRAMTERSYAALDEELSRSEFLAGEYSVGDMACFAWVYMAKWQGLTLDPWPNLKAWYDRLAARPAVARGNNIPPNKTKSK